MRFTFADLKQLVDETAGSIENANDRCMTRRAQIAIRVETAIRRAIIASGGGLYNSFGLLSVGTEQPAPATPMTEAEFNARYDELERASR